MTYPILATKLFVPSLRSNLVPRPRLIERLNNVLEGKLTLISAPAGYGKTTLLSQWISQIEIPVGWLTLDQSDNDLGRFLAYIIATLQSINIEVDAQILTLRQPHQTEDVETILIPLINQVAAADSPFALILDDYHLIQSQDIHEVLTYLLDHLPPNMHLIIASRADPPLPLARLRAQGQMAEIRTADLRFSPEEGDSLLNQVQGLKLSRPNIRALISRTDGWIAALQMASIAIKGKKDVSAYIRDFSGSRDYIADFLTAEVIDQQPEEIHEFLLKTSILDRLSGPLCQAITGQKNSSQILRQLKDANLFLIPLDDDSHWFRYHRLFADLINQRLLALYPDDVSSLYRRASEWFEAKDFPAEAIDYAFRGNLIQRATSLIETQAEPTLIRSEMATFIGWMRQLPDEVIFENELLCINYAWALLVNGEEPHAAISYLDQVTPSNQHTSSRLDAVRSMTALYQGQTSRAIKLARQAMDRLPEEDFFFRQIAAWNLSALLFISGDNEGGAKMLAEVAQISMASKNLLVAIVTLCRLGSVHFQQGDLHQAKEIFEQALQIAADDPKHPLPVACEAMFGLGKIYWEWYQLETAAKYLLEGIGLSKRWREITALESYIIMAHIKQTLAETDHVDQMIQVAKKLAIQNVATHVDEKFVASQEALLRLRQGNIQAAVNWAIGRELENSFQEKTLTSPPQHGADIILRYELLVYARILLIQNQSEEALRLLNLILPSMEQLGHRQKIIETHILIAIGLQAQGKTGTAVSSLKKAFSLAEMGGFIRIFLDEGPALAELIQETAARGVKSKFVATLIDAVTGDQEKSTLADSMIEPLSEREIEVLRLLATDLTGPEIAEHLYISVSTFRTHVKNIYTKLDVHSRFEAITRGKDLQLF
jgi:LuxR family maltose regulon positive regulatory protein